MERHKIDKNALINEHRILIVGTALPNEIECENTLLYDLSKIPSGVPKLVDGVIVPATLQDMYDWGMINIEDLKDEARRKRNMDFKALDAYDKAVLRGDITETETDKKLRDKFRQDWLDITNQFNENFENIELIKFPYMPDFIAYFRQFNEEV